MLSQTLAAFEQFHFDLGQTAVGDQLGVLQRGDQILRLRGFALRLGQLGALLGGGDAFGALALGQFQSQAFQLACFLVELAAFFVEHAHDLVAVEGRDHVAGLDRGAVGDQLGQRQHPHIPDSRRRDRAGIERDDLALEASLRRDACRSNFALPAADAHAGAAAGAQRSRVGGRQFDVDLDLEIAPVAPFGLFRRRADDAGDASGAWRAHPVRRN